MAWERTSSFGDQLRRLREAARQTQEELAERAGLSRDAVSALERGHRRHPQLHTVRALAIALGLSDEQAESLRASIPKRSGPRSSPVADLPPAALPVPATRLVGRQREMVEIRRLFDDGARLVTLTGPGGVGKTRLALELAAHLKSSFAGGVAFVSLAAVQDPALVLPMIAESLGVRGTGSRTLAQQLDHVLRDRRVLLVLDNFEHLTEAVMPVAELLATYPGLAVLATSRENLRLLSEREYQVPPLAAPVAGRQSGLAVVATSDAVALFVQRAQVARPDFALTAANAAAVAEICRRLDGLPLAIELAAARMKVLTAEALLARLGSGLHLLVGGPRDQAVRLQSMRAAIAWSYDLLDSGEQALFRCLSVFADSFTLHAGEAVARAVLGQDDARPAPVLPILDTIASLVDKSLLSRIATGNGELRFGMLETIREFGQEQLAAAGEAAAARDAHAACFLDLAERAWPTFRRRTGHEVWLERLEVERGNLRSALRWLAERKNETAVLQLAGALYWFWYIRGPISEGRAWLERALSCPAPSTIARVRALVGAGQLAHFQGDDDRAVAWLESALALSSELGDAWWHALALGVMATVAEDRGDYDQAEARFGEARALYETMDDPANLAMSLLHLGIVAWGKSDGGRAAELWTTSMELQRTVGDRWGLSISLAYLGLLATERGDLSRAAALHRESLQMRWESETWEDVAGSLADVATLAAAAGREEEAARLFAAADTLLEELGRVQKLPERGMYEQARARVRSAMGEQAYAAAFAAGRGVPLDEAVAAADALAAVIAGECAERDSGRL